MRDDALKDVALPRLVRRWAAQAGREADVVSGRAAEACSEALRDEWRRGTGATMQRSLRDLATGIWRSLPASLAEVDNLLPTPSGSFEMRLINEVHFLATTDADRSVGDVVFHAVATILQRQTESHLSELDAQGRLSRKQLQQMRMDLAKAVAPEAEELVRGGDQLPNTSGQSDAVSLNEDLLARDSFIDQAYP